MEDGGSKHGRVRGGVGVWGVASMRECHLKVTRHQSHCTSSNLWHCSILVGLWWGLQLVVKMFIVKYK